jgi:signal peptidase
MTAKKLLAITGKVALSLLLAVIVGALAVVTVVPRAVHGSALTVLTGSMTPTIPVGSVVVVEPVDPGTLHVGDVVTFQKEPGKPEYITHRIKAIHADTKPVTLTTKGDANRGEDMTPVPVTAVRGKVLFHVPYLGTIRNAISIRSGGLALVLVGLVLYALFQLVTGLRERHRAGNAATSPAGSTSSTASPPGLKLQLLVVTLPTVEFEGLLPHQVAELLRVDLLEEGPDQFTIAVTRELEQLDELTRLLLMFKPVTLVRSEVVEVPLCRPAVPDETPDDTGARREIAARTTHAPS